ncbi:hypothetical protein [Thioalkalivibrio sp. ALE16]|uniref:hypothetical protein n=1 Tax=Thioalkalivibrio sp. ALE16 TaxID=1158172 RepID=UPI000369DF2D|nr:hypothetical protein [Thioalkalivibrio sp. ALE16]
MTEAMTGTIRVPSKHWAKFKKAVLDAHDDYREAVYLYARAISDALDEQQSSTRDYMDRAREIAQGMRTPEQTEAMMESALKALKWTYTEGGVVERTKRPGKPSRQILEFDLETMKIPRRGEDQTLMVGAALLELETSNHALLWTIEGEEDRQALVEWPVTDAILDLLNTLPGMEDVDGFAEAVRVQPKGPAQEGQRATPF